MAKALFINWKKRLYYACFTPFHWLMRKRYGEAFFPKKAGKPKKILLCNLSALGDVFLSTFAISALKKAHPNAEIALLVSPASKVVGEGCPGVDRIHILSPWLVPSDSFLKKLRKYLLFHLIEKRKILKELGSHSYDWAINFYPFFSDVIPLFLRVKIPVRVGFDALGYRTLFSHTVSWERGKYLTDLYWRLLETVGIESTHKTHFFSPWIQIPRRPLPQLKEEYFLFHMGSATPDKDLPSSFWLALLEEFQKKDHQVYFTGKGEEQYQLIDAIVSDPRDNLCDLLSWEEFLQVIAHAKGVFSVDTVIVHIAAAMQTPYAVFYQKTPDPDLWRPDSERGLAFIKREEASAHHIHRKDERLIWVDDFDPNQVFAKVEEVLQ
ncbi:MAG: Lipopolysaccharide core heptosyltransferase RfaQ [Chlamydiae bacterium]|nr:Lipopolysaccharide core heptosyltransferase RfaQ [Chlamydiota bacterium]